MAADEKWYFTKEQLDSTPSRQCGYEANKELSYRQQAANFIQDMGQRLSVSQLCINTAIVYMHRFYVFHSFSHFPWQSIAAAAIFLAAKVEEQPRKLEHIIRVVHLCKNPHDRDFKFDVNSERYRAQSQDLVFNENILLQTLGFDVAIDHPHTHVVRCCHLVRASKDLAQTSYFMASYSLHLTTMCLQYKPTVVACFCIHLACKWSNWEIPLSNEKKEWFTYVDSTVTADLLKQLTTEFLTIHNNSQSRFKDKIMTLGGSSSMHYSPNHGNTPFENEPKKLVPSSDSKEHHYKFHHGDSKPGSIEDKHRSSRPHDPSSSNQMHREKEYREKKEREQQRLAAQQQHSSSKQLPAQQQQSPGKQSIPSHGHHHRPPVDPKLKQHSSRPQSISGHPHGNRIDPHRSEQHRDSVRELLREGGSRDLLHEQVRNSNNSDLSKTDSNNLIDQRTNYNKQHTDQSSRIRSLEHNKMLSKQQQHDLMRNRQQHDDTSKQHLKISDLDKNSASKTINSQKIKSPYDHDTSKSVPKQQHAVGGSKNATHHNGGSFSIPYVECNKEEGGGSFVHPVKKPSLFSPEKSPPLLPPPQTTLQTTLQTQTSVKKPTPPLPQPINSKTSNSKRVSDMNIPQTSPSEELKRTRSNDVKKNEQANYDATNLYHQQQQQQHYHHHQQQQQPNSHLVPDIITPISDNNEQSLSKELKPPDLIPPFNQSQQLQQQTSQSQQLQQSQQVPLLVNGIETNPTLISNLLKETPVVPHLGSITNSPVVEVVNEKKEKEHHHKSKKKNKEKHKHKDKDKSRDEKEKKKKHKDKHRNKHDVVEQPVVVAQPIKITISKDKIQPPSGTISDGNQAISGLKIKIPKDRIKTDTYSEAPTASGSSSSVHTNSGGSLKIKISKDVINNFNSTESSKKRERDRSPNNNAIANSSGGMHQPPTKVSKSSYNRNESKLNGRNSYNKVAHQGDGDTSVHRLAESKYINKGANST